MIWFSNLSNTFELAPVNGIKTIFVVFLQDGSSAQTKILGGDLVTTGSNGNVVLQREGGAGLIDSAVSSVSAFHVVTWQGEAGSYALFVDGSSKGTGTDPQALGGLDRIGNDLIGRVAEVVAFDRVLPSLTREKIEGYLAHKWGLVGQLPSDHPYRLLLPTFGG